MFELSTVLPHLQMAQWVVALLFVPLICWYEGLLRSAFCRWCALVSGYLVQGGFYWLIHESGFSVSALLMLSALIAAVWVHIFVRFWPMQKTSLVSHGEVDANA